MSNNMKKIIVSIIAVLLLVLVATTTFASSSIEDIINDMKKNNSENPSVENQNISEIPEVKEDEDTQKGNLNVGGNNNTPANDAPTTTPYTGIGDYSTYIFIGVFAVSAVYAYKKVREY